MKIASWTPPAFKKNAGLLQNFEWDCLTARATRVDFFSKENKRRHSHSRIIAIKKKDSWILYRYIRWKNGRYNVQKGGVVVIWKGRSRLLKTYWIFTTPSIFLRFNFRFFPNFRSAITSFFFVKPSTPFVVVQHTPSFFLKIPGTVLCVELMLYLIRREGGSSECAWLASLAWPATTRATWATNSAAANRQQRRWPVVPAGGWLRDGAATPVTSVGSSSN